EADALGRVCRDQAELVQDAQLFLEYAGEHGCASGPYRFPTDHTRFVYFRGPGRSHEHEAFDDTRCQVLVMSGLPGAGKDTWLQRNRPGLPVVSLDEIRRELKVRPGDDQAPVAELARERARTLLRAGTPFGWNATNLSREQRGRCLDLLADYRARIRVVYCEAPAEELERRNRERGFPASAVERLLERWEVPDPCEAHEVVWETGA
ncbi:MAG: AAA family ATPase, partial [Candidatus Eremiobacterota bacterium]